MNYFTINRKEKRSTCHREPTDTDAKSQEDMAKEAIKKLNP